MLVTVKLLHTAVWAFFAACILAIPAAAVRNEFGWAAGLSGVVVLECVVLVLNGRRCPLTDLARRYTEERQANFDIYLPLWVAKHNQRIFGTLYLVALMYTAARWITSR